MPDDTAPVEGEGDALPDVPAPDEVRGVVVGGRRPQGTAAVAHPDEGHVPMARRSRSPSRDGALWMRTAIATAAALIGAQAARQVGGGWWLPVWWIAVAGVVGGVPWARHVGAFLRRSETGQDRPALDEARATREVSLTRRGAPHRRWFRYAGWTAWAATFMAAALAEVGFGWAVPGFAVGAGALVAALGAPGLWASTGRPQLRLLSVPRAGESLVADLTLSAPLVRCERVACTLRLVVEEAGTLFRRADEGEGPWGLSFDPVRQTRWHKTRRFDRETLGRATGRRLRVEMKIDVDERDPYRESSWAGRPVSQYELDVEVVPRARAGRRTRRARAQRHTFVIPVYAPLRKPPRLIKSRDTARQVRIGECPRCEGQALDELMRCPRCAGELLDEQSVEDLAVTRLRLEGRADLMRMVAEFGRKSCDCPRCGRRMAEVAIKGETVDLCAGCGGLWLDGGEYLRIRDRAEQMLTVDDVGEG